MDIEKWREAIEMEEHNNAKSPKNKRKPEAQYENW